MNHEQLLEEGQKIVQKAPQAFFDIDVESDGWPGFGSLLSIGGVSPWGDEFYAEIKPTSQKFIADNKQFCEEHGLQRERLIREGRELPEVITELGDWVEVITSREGKTDAVLTAFNASYDFAWIDYATREAGIDKNLFGIAGFCIKSLAMCFAQEYDWKKTSKGSLPDILLPEGDFTHNALEDSIYQQKIHFAMAALISFKNKKPIDY